MIRDLAFTILIGLLIMGICFSIFSQAEVSSTLQNKGIVVIREPDHVTKLEMPECKLDILELYREREEVYVGETFELIALVKNTGSTTICISLPLSIIDWGPKEYLEQLPFMCPFRGSEKLKPGEVFGGLVEHCVRFKALKPGRVKFVVEATGCPGSAPTNGEGCECLTNEFCRAVKEFEIKILPTETVTVDVWTDKGGRGVGNLAGGQYYVGEPVILYFSLNTDVDRMRLSVIKPDGSSNVLYNDRIDAGTYGVRGTAGYPIGERRVICEAWKGYQYSSDEVRFTVVEQPRATVTTLTTVTATTYLTKTEYTTIYPTLTVYTTVETTTTYTSIVKLRSQTTTTSMLTYTSTVWSTTSATVTKTTTSTIITTTTTTIIQGVVMGLMALGPTSRILRKIFKRRWVRCSNGLR